MSKIVFIVGPTATGKSDVAFSLAKEINAEIVSCDSMLVYKEPRIITSKPSAFMLNNRKHHFIDLISVEDSYDVFTYYANALALINELYEQRINVIVCGGTGLYAQILLDGIFQGTSKDHLIRKELEQEAATKGKEYLYHKLEKVDPQAAKRIACADLRRIVRALEVYYKEGIPISEKQKQRQGLWSKYKIPILGLTMERKLLYERINERTHSMFVKGAVSEVEQLLKLKLSLTAQKIIGIKELQGFLEKEYSKEEAYSLMSRNTRNLAKRQLTWFRRDERIRWIDVGSLDIDDIIKYILDNVIDS
jgi:tRNA dimethylallyltransferase